MCESVIVRRAKEEDAGDIARIYNYAVLNTTATFDMEPKSVEDRVEWLREHGEQYPVFVAELNNKIVGWSSLSPYGERPAYRFTVENAIYIDCEYQGRGIGSLLLQVLLQSADESGYHAVIALVVKGNDSSARLHERFDFKLVGVMHEVGRKFDRWLDLLIYEKILSNDNKAGLVN